MASNLEISCTCGGLTGSLNGIEPSVGNHCVCYCDDCQLFPHHLGRADEILDENGGTGIFQTSAARLEFTDGADLRCLRLTEKGLLRWYAGCCNTPIANTLGRWDVPFAGVLTSCLGGEQSTALVDEALGPVRGRVFAGMAKGTPPAGAASGGFEPKTITRFLRVVLAARFRGDQRRSPFFDPDTHEPRATPHVLTPDERRHAAHAREAWLA